MRKKIDVKDSNGDDICIGDKLTVFSNYFEEPEMPSIFRMQVKSILVSEENKNEISEMICDGTEVFINKEKGDVK